MGAIKNKKKHKELKLFLRIDDVGDWRIDKDFLRPVLEKLLTKKIPANLEVIPACLSEKTVVYLNDLRKLFPDLIEIHQHGYSHNTYEFSLASSYSEQKKLIQKGYSILKSYFNDFTLCFTPPEHVYTVDTLKALNDLGFMIFSRQIKPTLDGKLFYFIGRKMSKYCIFGKRISYHNRYIPKTRLFELSIAIELSSRNIIKTPEMIDKEIRKASWTVKPLGLLVHHSLLKDKRNMKNMMSIIEFLEKTRTKSFYTLGQLLPVNWILN